ncbi:hypothetical protein E2C01_007954 [Portunus trituberculatus]|uniref:Uncharacterized protein n=1 Tax=Portunus trituberculatus TaxID=210409 RepID=A0A5B7D0C1_PORTR|nr:hypothetical protein [Portunus trituberculatus]
MNEHCWSGNRRAKQDVTEEEKYVFKATDKYEKWSGVIRLASPHYGNHGGGNYTQEREENGEATAAPARPSSCRNKGKSVSSLMLTPPPRRRLHHDPREGRPTTTTTTIIIITTTCTACLQTPVTQELLLRIHGLNVSHLLSLRPAAVTCAPQTALPHPTPPATVILAETIVTTPHHPQAPM